MLTIAVAFSMNTDIFLNSLTHKAEIREVKRNFQSVSDHMAYALLYKKWQSIEDLDELEKFNYESRLAEEKIKIIKCKLKIF